MAADLGAAASGRPEGVNASSWGGIAETDLAEALAAQSTLLALPADAVLFHQGDAPQSVFLLKTGEVDLIMLSSEDEPVMMARAAAGAVLGLSALFSHKPYAMTAKARTDVEIYAIQEAQFNKLMERNPRAALQALQVLAAETHLALEALARSAQS
jgi:CRP-like cAMP-binding protein